MVNNQKVLFIGLSCVGDVVMTSPVIQSLHDHFPGATFDIVADDRSRELYAECPFLNKIFIKDKRRFLRGVPLLLFQLWPNYYDVIVDVRTDGLTSLIRGRKKFTKRNAKAYGQHAVERLMGVIAELHGDKPIPDTTAWYNESDRDFATNALGALQDTGKLLAISVGDPAKPHKGWLVEKWISMLQQQKYFSSILFLGGDAEQQQTLKIIESIDVPSINMTGKSTLPQVAALLEQAKLYIGPDSGLGHIASAVKTPTVSFFSAFPPDRYRPWGGRSECLIGVDKDARNIPVDDVLAAIGKAIQL